MTTIQPIPATTTVMTSIIMQTIAVTYTIDATPAATTVAEPDPQFVDTMSGTLSFLNLALVFSNLLVITILGTFNRFVAVPLVASASLCVGNALDWYGWQAVNTHSASSRRIAILMSNILYGIFTVTISLYSLFLLQKVLPRFGHVRKSFFAVCGILYLSWAAVYAVNLRELDKYSTSPPEDSDAIGYTIDKLTRAYISIFAALEVWCALFLIRTFYSAKRQSAVYDGVGEGDSCIWRGLVRSSELRLSLLSVLFVVRCICFRSNDWSNEILRGVDTFTWVLQNCFPLVLQLDLLAAKMLGMKRTTTVFQLRASPRRTTESDREEIAERSSGSPAGSFGGKSHTGQEDVEKGGGGGTQISEA